MKGIWILDVLEEGQAGFLDELDMECEKNKSVKNGSNVLALYYKLDLVLYNPL